jgi:hypothetical protein
MRTRGSLGIVAAALVLCAVVSYVFFDGAKPSTKKQQPQAAAVAEVKQPLPPQPVPPTPDEIARAVVLKMPDILTKEDVAEVVAKAAAKCNKPNAARGEKKRVNPSTPVATAPTPQPTAAAPATQPVAVAAAAAAQTPPVASQPATTVSVSFPGSIRMESALTDVPPCQKDGAEPDEKGKHKGKNKPCPMSLAERQTIAQEKLARNVGKTIWPLRVIAVASVVSAGANVATAVRTGGVTFKNAESCSTVTGSCVVGEKMLTGAAGATFKVAPAN